jgi:nucleoside-diphosphate-sugar epimerase
MEVWRATQEGLDAVIVNPGVILGAGSWHTGSGAIFKLASKGMSYFTGGSIALVDVKDVVLAMQQLMLSDLKNERYILVGATLSYKEFTKKLALAFGKKPPKKEIAMWKLLLMSTIDAMISGLFGTKRKLLKANVKSLYTLCDYDTQKIKKALDFNFTGVSQTITRVAEQYTCEH